MPPPDRPAALAATALASAEAAAAVHRRWSGGASTLDARVKGKGDFVSDADLEAQEAALAVIAERYPEHEVMAEEGDVAERRADGPDPLWVVDPLDGTTNFLHGHPMHAASVGVAVAGRPVAGAVVCPATGERWWAARGEGAWKNGLRLRVAAEVGIGSALVGTGFPFKSLELLDDYLAQLGRVLTATAGVRRGGAAALDLCYLAEGRFDAFWELFLNPWDFAAGWVIVEEAGGVMSRVDGSELTLAPGTVMGASGPATIEALRAVLGA